MKDIIDLGNLVFDRLIELHGEVPESRMLFLYSITTSSSWSVIGTDKWVTVQADGVSTNLEDSRLQELSAQWQALKAAKDTAEVAERIKRFREEYERPSPKDGDTFNFWSDSGTFREIRL